MRHAVLVLTLLAAACGPSPEDKAREDAAAIAAVNAAQNRLPPIKALSLEQFTPGDFARMDDTGASCAFYAETRAIAMARPSYAWIKLDGELIRLVSDSGSGFTWAGNSQSNRLTPWNNDPVSDAPGEALAPSPAQTHANATN